MQGNARKRTKKVRFVIATDPGSAVYVAGTFNNWNPAQYQMREYTETGVFKIALPLPPGRHEYKFFVNGEWRLDPGCTHWQSSDVGSLNSVVSV